MPKIRERFTPVCERITVSLAEAGSGGLFSKIRLLSIKELRKALNHVHADFGDAVCPELMYIVVLGYVSERKAVDHLRNLKRY